MNDSERKELLLKAKPILFNTDMVRAIQNGSKTVIRRVVKPQPVVLNSLVIPPYKVGDILYVKETWCGNSYKYFYRADGEEIEIPTFDGNTIPFGKADGLKWNTSVHMPKKAARIFLRVTNVRVERLQDITDDDCMAEGICSWTKDGKLYKYYLADEDGDYPACEWSKCPKTPQAAMKRIWNSTVKKSDLDKYSWVANPWVWVVEFERIN